MNKAIPTSENRKGFSLPVHLLFPEKTPDNKDDFSVRHNKNSIRQLRVSILLSIFVYSIFAFLDIYSVPEKTYILLLIRFAGFLPVAILLLLLTYKDWFYRHYQLLVALFAFIASIGLLCIHIIASAFQFYGYQYAILLSLIFVYMLLHLRFIWASIVGWALFAIYDLLTVFILGIGDESWLNGHILFVFINLFGMFSVWFIERQEWREFTLKNMLEQEKQKTEKLNQELEEQVQIRTYQLKKTNAELQWVNESLEKTIEENNQYQMVLLKDVNERKLLQEKLTFLSYHDHLTGIYNRRFYEEESRRLDVPRNFPITLLMADVNGLKLINDSFGHVHGDKILQVVAEIMKSACRADDIVARLGGDEFILLLPKTDTTEAEDIMNRMRQMAQTKRVDSIEVSISFGLDTKTDDCITLQEVFNQAEDKMYQNKLFESPTMRSRTIKAIMNILNEKNKMEAKHAQRVSDLCRNMGIALKLPDSEVQELQSIGLLHDIGNIAIHEDLLTKETELTTEEWTEIKRHPEIGYRILSTVNDMSEMADYVLAHHEKWNGTGYPKGLFEKETPLQARIISIADAYDAMTGGRSYRGPWSTEEACRELKNYAGVQFDPELVDVFIKQVVTQINPPT